MTVRRIAVRHEMVVPVGMGDRVRVDAVAVEMREGVLVRMGVVPHERIDHDKRRPCGHHAKCRKIHPRQILLQQDKRKESPQERRNGIVGTRFRRAARQARHAWLRPTRRPQTRRPCRPQLRTPRTPACVRSAGTPLSFRNILLFSLFPSLFFVKDPWSTIVSTLR